MTLKTMSLAMFAGITLGFSSCASVQKTVNYSEAQRYFVRNDVTDYSPRVIRSEAELERYFGMAAVMSTDGSGLPTAIDFTQKAALAIIEPQTNVDTQIKIVSVKTGKDGKTTVRYKVLRSGSPRSYSTVPCLLVQIDKQYGGNVEFVKE